MKTTRMAALAALVILVVAGCPMELPVSDHWQPVASAPEAESTVESEHQKRALKTAAAIRVKRMQAVFVSDEERRCHRDDDCVLTPFHCCDCTGGGQQDAVHRDHLPALLQRRIAYCADEVCPQVMSTHASCSATKATCQDARCVPHVDGSPHSAGAVVVEPILNDDGAGDVAP